MSFVSAIKAKVSAALVALGADATKLLVGFGDEGSVEPYNTVTVQDTSFLLGQAWSGPPADAEAPEAGPVPAMVNKSAMAQLVIAVGAVQRPSFGFSEVTQATGTAATLTMSTVNVDTDLYTHSSGEWTVLNAGRYRVDYSIWGEGATDVTVVRTWVEVDTVESYGSRAVASADSSTGEDSARGSAVFELSANQVVRVRHQKTTGTTFNIKYANFAISLEG